MAGEEDKLLEQPMKIIMKIIILGYIWSVKVTWKFFKFTGLWVAALILALDAGFKTVGVPGDIWGVPFLLALVFAVCWTGWKFYQKSQAPSTTSESQAVSQSGVFFGTTFPERGWNGWNKETQSKPVTKPQDADGHVLVVGGAGSGKSSCIAIPTLRDTWTAPALVVDIKGELYEKSRRPHAAVFNPLDKSALGYDPFYLLRESENPLPDIRDIALTLCPLPADVRDPFWIQAAQNILTGHLLYGFKGEAPFIETIEVLQSLPPKKLLEAEVKDREASRYLVQYADLKAETLASIMAELSNKVMAFATDPYIQATLTKKEIINPSLLEEGSDIFLHIPEYKLEAWRPMISLIVQQFARHFEKRPDTGATPVLFLLDEFARLGKMEAVIHGLATLRSKKITIMPIIQSLAQLDATYGHDERKVICDNCSYKAILNATDAESQEYFSKLVGTYEKEKVTTSYEGSGWLAEAKGVSRTTEEKRVIKPEEFAYLSDMVLLTPFGVKRVQKRPYYLSAPALVHVASAPPPYAQGYQAKPSPAPASTQQPRAPAVSPSAVSRQTRERFAASLPPEEREIIGQAEKLRAGHVAPPPGATPASGNGKTPQQYAATQYEAALTTLAKFAPAGTSAASIAMQLASKLPPKELPGFLAWWQQQRNGK